MRLTFPGKVSGKFRTVREEKFDGFREALAAVQQHAEAGGYTNVKEVEESDGFDLRYTAKTPGGRGGRNVAFADWDMGDDG